MNFLPTTQARARGISVSVSGEEEEEADTLHSGQTTTPCHICMYAKCSRNAVAVRAEQRSAARKLTGHAATRPSLACLVAFLCVKKVV